MFNGEVDETSRRRKSLFSNTLVLPGFDALEATKIDDSKKLDSVKHTLVLRGRHLENAVFYDADLRKADLEGADLQGARLGGAQLQGATLGLAQLQGASLLAARLQGATLEGAQLQGAQLLAARLQGVTLGHAQLQGADFTESTFAGTDMSNAAVWRTNFEGTSLTAVFEDDAKESAISKAEFATFRAMIIKEVPEGKQRERALKGIEKLNPDIFGPEASEQETLEKGRVDETTYKKSLADHVKSLACSGGENGPYIVRQLAAYRISQTGAQAPGLFEAIFKPDCPVSAALTETDKAALKRIAKEASGAH